MAITNYSQVRSGATTIVTVVSSLTGLVYYHWYVDGAYAATTTAPTHTFSLELGEQVRIEVLDTNDANFDPITNAPAGYPARVSLWWTRSESPDAVKYKVLMKHYGEAEVVLAEIGALPNQWVFSMLSPTLPDGLLTAFKVIPVDAAGNEGDGVVLSPFSNFVRTPDAPRFGATYDGGTQKVTFAAV